MGAVDGWLDHAEAVQSGRPWHLAAWNVRLQYLDLCTPRGVNYLRTECLLELVNCLA